MNEPKHRERLPTDLRAGLPAQGFVNLSEAQAIVRRLAECARAGVLPSAPHGESTVFIIALYEAQAELIRRLLRNTFSCGPLPIDRSGQARIVCPPRGLLGVP